MLYIEHENEAFVQAVKMQHQVKGYAIKPLLKHILVQPQEMEMNNL